jgi:transcription elongation factor GreA
VTRLTPDAAARLSAERDRARQRIDELDAFLREQLLCACDTDEITLRDARTERERLLDRTQRLSDTLDAASTIPSGELAHASVVASGVPFRLRDLDDGSEVRVTIGPDLDVDVGSPGALRVSEASPLGRAVLGRTVGERFEVAPRAGVTLRYEVVELLVGPTASGR